MTRPNSEPPEEELRRLLYLRDWDAIYDQGWSPIVIGRMGHGISNAFTLLEQIARSRGDVDRLAELEQQRQQHEEWLAGLRRRPNPFYLSVKPEGQKIQRMGPMSEADFWIEDMEVGQPIHTGADPTFEEIGQLLRQRRMEVGLTQKDVAKMADLATSTVLDIEHGKTRPPQAVLKQIAKVLGSYFEGPLPSRRRNPIESDVFDEIDEDNYRTFHGVSPDEVVDMRVWVPGGMVLIGTGKDVGYGITNKESFKDGWYVHDFGSGVKIYRRCRSGEAPTKTWRSFPTQLTNLGWNLGFTYNDGGPDGPMKEVKGSRSKKLAVTPNRKTLVVLDGVGVLYLMEGGSMRVDDWIRD